MKKRFKTAVAVMLLLGLMTLFAVASNAAEPANRLTIRCLFDEKPVADETLRLYQVGEKTETGYRWLAPYDTAELGEYTENMPSDALGRAADTLTELIRREQPAAFAETRTDETGTGRFQGLPDGVFLVLGEAPGDLGGETYVQLPLLVHLPYTQNGETSQDVTADVKYERVPPETTTTPETTTVPGETTTTPGQTTTRPTVTTTTPGRPGLPNTGQLRWPIPVLSAAGAILIAAGLILRRKERKRT